MKAIRVNLNIWGNYACFVGSERVATRGNMWDAVEWVSEKLAEGYKLSPKSGVKMKDVEAFRAKFH